MTAIVVFFSIAVLLILAISVTRRSILLSEGIVVWTVLQVLYSNYFGIFSYNMRWISPNEDVQAHLAYVSFLCVSAPMITIFALERMTGAGGAGGKLAAAASALALPFGLERLAAWMGVITFGERWRTGWSVLLWAASVVLAMAALGLMRRLARKEGVRPT